MSNGPVAGNNIPALTIPQGKLVYYVAMAQSATSQFAQLIDSSGHKLITVSGAAPNRQTPQLIGSGFFTSQDPSQQYTLNMGINGTAGNVQVIWSENVLSLGSLVYLVQYTFIAEDYTDQDYNDCCLIIQWFTSAG